MTKETAIKLFQDQKVRVHWDKDQEKWYFSIIDIIEVLTESPRPRKYWNALKTKLQNEGSELSHKLGQLKMKATDGKMRMTNEITKAWTGMTTREYKDFKDLKKENLRDNYDQFRVSIEYVSGSINNRNFQREKPKNLYRK